MYDLRQPGACSAGGPDLFVRPLHRGPWRSPGRKTDKKGRGTFDTVMENIALLRRRGIEPGILMVLNTYEDIDYALEKIPPVIKLLRDLSPFGPENTPSTFEKRRKP